MITAETWLQASAWQSQRPSGTRSTALATLSSCPPRPPARAHPQLARVYNRATRATGLPGWRVARQQGGSECPTCIIRPETVSVRRRQGSSSVGHPPICGGTFSVALARTCMRRGRRSREWRAVPARHGIIPRTRRGRDHRFIGGLGSRINLAAEPGQHRLQSVPPSCRAGGVPGTGRPRCLFPAESVSVAACRSSAQWFIRVTPATPGGILRKQEPRRSRGLIQRS